MIMDVDLMATIGTTAYCDQICIRWGVTEIPLKTINTLSDDEILQILYNAQQMNQVSRKKQKRDRAIS
jgi:hypothetical protein